MRRNCLLLTASLSLDLELSMCSLVQRLLGTWCKVWFLYVLNHWISDWGVLRWRYEIWSWVWRATKAWTSLFRNISCITTPKLRSILYLFPLRVHCILSLRSFEFISEGIKSCLSLSRTHVINLLDIDSWILGRIMRANYPSQVWICKLVTWPIRVRRNLLLEAYLTCHLLPVFLIHHGYLFLLALLGLSILLITVSYAILGVRISLYYISHNLVLGTASNMLL